MTLREKAEAWAHDNGWAIGNIDACDIETGDVLDMMAAFAAEQVKAEREACADVCEEMVPDETPDVFTAPRAFVTAIAAQYCADRIRARNETDTP
jgi:hypothetical protein